MGQHYLDPVQYLLGKDDTSPIRVDVDAPQQHYDAAGSWRRIEFTYADGCKIILDGENKDTEAAYITGPKGKIFRGFRSDIPKLQELIATLPDPEPQIAHVLRLGALAPQVRAQRVERPPVVHDRQPRDHRRPAGPDASLRPGRAAVRERRGGQPADRPADARALGAVSRRDEDQTMNTHHSTYRRVVAVLGILLLGLRPRCRLPPRTCACCPRRSRTSSPSSRATLGEARQAGRRDPRARRAGRRRVREEARARRNGQRHGRPVRPECGGGLREPGRPSRSGRSPSGRSARRWGQPPTPKCGRSSSASFDRSAATPR